VPYIVNNAVKKGIYNMYSYFKLLKAFKVIRAVVLLPSGLYLPCQFIGTPSTSTLAELPLTCFDFTIFYLQHIEIQIKILLSYYMSLCVNFASD